MDFVILLGVGLAVGVTTVVFGFGGGFVTVPIIAVVDARFGGDALRIATATSAVVMLVNAVVATVSTRRDVLRDLRGQRLFLGLLAVGGALGAVASQYLPAAVVRWGFVAYMSPPWSTCWPGRGSSAPTTLDLPPAIPVGADRCVRCSGFRSA